MRHAARIKAKTGKGNVKGTTIVAAQLFSKEYSLKHGASPEPDSVIARYGIHGSQSPEPQLVSTRVIRQDRYFSGLALILAGSSAEGL